MYNTSCSPYDEDRSSEYIGKYCYPARTGHCESVPRSNVSKCRGCVSTTPRFTPFSTSTPSYTPRTPMYRESLSRYKGCSNSDYKYNPTYFPTSRCSKSRKISDSLPSQKRALLDSIDDVLFNQHSCHTSYPKPCCSPIGLDRTTYHYKRCCMPTNISPIYPELKRCCNPNPTARETPLLLSQTTADCPKKSASETICVPSSSNRRSSLFGWMEKYSPLKYWSTFKGTSSDCRTSPTTCPRMSASEQSLVSKCWAVFHKSPRGMTNPCCSRGFYPELTSLGCKQKCSTLSTKKPCIPILKKGDYSTPLPKTTYSTKYGSSKSPPHSSPFVAPKTSSLPHKTLSSPVKSATRPAPIDVTPEPAGNDAVIPKIDDPTLNDQPENSPEAPEITESNENNSPQYGNPLNDFFENPKKEPQLSDSSEQNDENSDNSQPEKTQPEKLLIQNEKDSKQKEKDSNQKEKDSKPKEKNSKQKDKDSKHKKNNETPSSKPPSGKPCNPCQKKCSSGCSSDCAKRTTCVDVDIVMKSSPCSSLREPPQPLISSPPIESEKKAHSPIESPKKATIISEPDEPIPIASKMSNSGLLKGNSITKISSKIKEFTTPKRNSGRTSPKVSNKPTQTGSNNGLTQPKSGNNGPNTNDEPYLMLANRQQICPPSQKFHFQNQSHCQNPCQSYNPCQQNPCGSGPCGESTFDQTPQAIDTGADVCSPNYPCRSYMRGPNPVCTSALDNKCKKPKCCNPAFTVASCDSGCSVRKKPCQEPTQQSAESFLCAQPRFEARDYLSPDVNPCYDSERPRCGDVRWSGPYTKSMKNDPKDTNCHIEEFGCIPRAPMKSNSFTGSFTSSCVIS